MASEVDERLVRFVSKYLEHEMPDAGAEEIEAMALKFLAELQDMD